MLKIVIPASLTKLQQDFLTQGCELANRALLDPSFASLWHQESPTYNNNCSQETILASLKEGEILLNLNFYTPFWPWSSVVSYESGGSIYYNSRKFNSLSVNDLSSNLLHEASHKLGFTHPGNKPTPSVLHTVPYTLNRVFEAWINPK